MIHVYASHAITVEVWPGPEPNEWRPEVNIRILDDPTNTFRNLPSKPIFGTRAEAESSALEFAKKWIDAGKPDPFSQQ